MEVTENQARGASKSPWAKVSPVLTLEEQITKNKVDLFRAMSSFPITFQRVVPIGW